MPRRHVHKPHQRFSMDMPCSNKRRFASEAEALRALEITSLNDLRVILRTYRCPYCMGWHLSSGAE